MSEETDFDPLSFFSSAPEKEQIQDNSLVIEEAPFTLVQEQSGTKRVNNKPEENREENSEDDDEDSIKPLHVLDLPMLKNKPPADILIVFLKLLGRGEILNFGYKKEMNNENNIVNDKKVEEELQEKGITFDEFNKSLKWFELNTPALGTASQLLNLSESLKHNPDYVPYLTNIISSPLDWIPDAEVIEMIWDLASMRISETSGHFLSSEFIRKIVLENFNEILKLKEPSVTEDNLGLKTWGSSLVLSQRLVNDYEKLLLEPIIELGAGTGLVGITCAKLGYTNLMLTDLPEIVSNLYDNVVLNDLPTIKSNNKDGERVSGSSSVVKVDVLDWSQPQDFINKYPNSKKGYNTIILSDPIYSPMHPIWVGDMVSKLLSENEDSRVLLQIPIRERFEKERSLMFEVMDKLNMEEVETYNEDGVDDFGKKEYLFKVYKWKFL